MVVVFTFHAFEVISSSFISSHRVKVVWKGFDISVGLIPDPFFSWDILFFNFHFVVVSLFKFFFSVNLGEFWEDVVLFVRN